MSMLSKYKTLHGLAGVIALLVTFCFSPWGSSVFAACTKENDCFSCHTAQELRKVHKNCQYLEQGCLACHKAPVVSSDLAKEGGAPYGCSQGETSPGMKEARCAEITSEVHLGTEDWAKLQRTVHETVEGHRVGRKFIEVYGPLGTGAQCVPLDTYAIPSWANVDMLGEGNEAIHSLKREIAHIPLIYKDFWLEDDLIFHGLPEMGMSGLLNANGRNILKLSDWSVIGNGFQDIVSAVEKLRSSGFSPPYALVVSPKLYALLHKVYERTGKLEIEGVKELVKGGVYQSPVFKKDVALVVATGRQNLDLAVGINFKVEYWGSQDLNHRFRVVGSSVLRIKCPQAICTLE